MTINKIFIVSLILLSISFQAKAEKIEFIDVKISNNKNPIISIETNLPDGMEISVDLNKVGGGYGDGFEGVVNHGRITTTKFSQDGGPLPSGQYMIMILSSGAQFEPEPIQKIIGENGKNLIGPDVKDSTVGVGNVIDKRVFFNVP